jgi:lipopolysaccharide transport system permease protein
MLRRSMMMGQIDQSVPVTVVRSRSGWAGLGLDVAWGARELIAFFALRDIRVRYRQTFLGVAWVVLQPLLAVLIFAVLFGRVLKVPSDGAPYAVFACAALVPWQFFAGVTNRCAQSLVSNASLLTKVYFPRLALPLGVALAASLDFAVGLVVLMILGVAWGVLPGASLGWLALAIPQLVVAAVGAGLWASAANVRFRDVGHALPFVLQVGLFLTPVIYASSSLPPRLVTFAALNPMTAPCEVFRLAILGHTSAQPWVLGVSASIGWVLLLTGLVFFRRAERTFADTV